MKIVVDTKELKEKIKDLMLAAGAKVVGNDCVNAIKFEVDDSGLLKMTSYNMTVAIEVVMKIYNFLPGNTCIQAKMLSDIVSKCDSQNISIEVDEMNRCTLKSGTASFRLLTTDVENFPEIPSTGDIQNIEVNAEELVNAANDVAYAAALDDRRPIMCGVCFKFKEGNVDIVSSDGYRIAKRSVETSSGREFEIVVPKDTVGIISKISRGAEGNAKIFASRNFIVFCVNNETVTSRLLSGQYLEWEKVIPKDFEVKTELNKSDILKSIEMATTFQVINSAKKTGVPIMIEIENDSVKIKLKSQLGEFEDRIESNNKQNKNIQIALNPKFVIDSLRSIKYESITIMINKPLEPVFITGIKNENDFDVILPVRVKN